MGLAKGTIDQEMMGQMAGKFSAYFAPEVGWDVPAAGLNARGSFMDMMGAVSPVLSQHYVLTSQETPAQSPSSKPCVPSPPPLTAIRSVWVAAAPIARRHQPLLHQRSQAVPAQHFAYHQPRPPS